MSLVFSGYSEEDAVRIAAGREASGDDFLYNQLFFEVHEAVQNIVLEYDSFILDTIVLTPGRLLVHPELKDVLTPREFQGVVRRHCLLDWSFMSLEERRAASVGLTFDGEVRGRYLVSEYVAIAITAADRSHTQFFLSGGVDA
jgi:hypothetical protein